MHALLFDPLLFLFLFFDRQIISFRIPKNQFIQFIRIYSQGEEEGLVTYDIFAKKWAQLCYTT